MPGSQAQVTRSDGVNVHSIGSDRLPDLIVKPPEYSTRRRALPLAASILTATITISVYGATIAPDISWAHSGADGAELITAAVTLGVPHPPGYPLYVLLGKLVSLAPVGTVAFRFNLFSAICMTASAALLSHLTADLIARAGAPAPGTRRTATRWPDASVLSLATFAGLTFAFTPVVWQQALIAEVYALNMLAVSLFLWFALRAPTRRRGGWLPGILLGVAITTHLTSILLVPLALLAIRHRCWMRFSAGLAFGLVPFLTLPLLAKSGSPIVWGMPTTLEGWWWLVTAEIYQSNVFGLNFTTWGERVSAWSRELTIWIAVALMVTVVLRRRFLAGESEMAFPPLLLVTAPAVYFAYAFAYEAPDALVMSLPAFAMLCVAVALALPRVAPWYLLVPLALVAINFQRIDLSKNTEARMVAQPALQKAPPKAIILTSGDRTTFTLWYLQRVEGQREDVAVVDADLLAFDWYRMRVARAYPDLVGLDQDDLTGFRRHNEQLRPWCEAAFGPNRMSYTHCVKEPA